VACEVAPRASRSPAPLADSNKMIWSTLGSRRCRLRHDRRPERAVPVPGTSDLHRPDLDVITVFVRVPLREFRRPVPGPAESDCSYPRYWEGSASSAVSSAELVSPVNRHCAARGLRKLL